MQDQLKLVHQTTVISASNFTFLVSQPVLNATVDTAYSP